MTYHRTGGKGGTRNSARERHAEYYLPEIGLKSTKRGFKRPARKGKTQLNPKLTKSQQKDRDRAQSRYKLMMAKARDKSTTEADRRPKRSTLDKWLAGKSGITDF